MNYTNNPKQLSVNFVKTSEYFKSKQLSNGNHGGAETVPFRCSSLNYKRMTACLSMVNNGTKIPILTFIKLLTERDENLPAVSF